MSTIMVVDDMAVFREPIAAALRQRGYRTLCAANGQLALDAMRTERPDLILLDMAMPVMDGEELLKIIRQDPRLKDVPVILLTAVAERDYIMRMGRLGVRDYLLKSRFSLAELSARVEKHLVLHGQAQFPEADRFHPEAGRSPPEASPQAPAEAPAPASASPESSPSGPISESVAGSTDDTDRHNDAAQTLKDLRPIVTRSEVQASLDNCGELKGLSPTVSRVIEMTRQSQCSVDTLAKAIQQDQAVALKILKLANSAVYTRGEPVDSVLKAVMRIGMAQIRQTVLNISVIDKFSREDTDQRLNAAQFWEHAIACGLIASEITRATGGKEPQIDAAFAMGLLHDVGRQVYSELFGERYTRVLDAADRLQEPLEQVESRLLLINHADAMDRVLHAWGFPKDLINPIAFHHLSVGNIRRMAPHMLTEVATLALANRLAHALLLGSSGNLTIYPIDEFITALRLKGRLIAQIEKDVPSQTEDIKFAMLARSNQRGWERCNDQVRNQLTTPIRPVHVSLDPETDVFRIFCDRLRDDTSEGPPNVVVCYIVHGRDKAALSTKLREAQGKLDALPLVMLSPNGNLALEDSVMAKRKVEMLAVPVTVAAFVATMNKLLDAKRAAAA